MIIYHLAQQLSARHHQIDLLAFYSDPTDPDQIDHYRDFFSSVRLIPEPHRRLSDYLDRLARPARMFPRRAADSWSPAMWQAIEASLTTTQYDVIELFGGIQVYEYHELARRRPTVIVPYESYTLFLQRALRQQSPPLRRVLTRLQLTIAKQYERRMFRGYDRVVVLADPDAHALNALDPMLPVRVIPNGIDLDYFTPRNQPSNESILLFLGNFEYAPNIDAALHLARDIMPLVKRHVPQVKLVLVGNNPPAALRTLADTNITVTGRVPDVRPYLEQASIFVSPLRFGAGIKNKTLEAMAMAKPIVATPLSGDGIGLIDGQNVLYGASATDLADAAIRLLQDSALRQQMAVANRQLIEARYTWTVVADQYEALYREISAQWNADFPGKQP